MVADAGLWTPDQNRVGQLHPPAGDVRLADGRLLIKGGMIALEDSEEGGVWDGPRGIRVTCSRDRDPRGWLLHASVSYVTPARPNPSWREIRMVRDAFFPDDVDCMMVLPRKEDYVAGVTGRGMRDSNVFHVFQMPFRWGNQ